MIVALPFLIQNNVQAQTVDICSRTDQVEAGILAAVNAMSGVSGVTCSTVTSAQLAAITGTLSLNDSTADDDNDDITTLQAGDFEGLSGVVILNLIDNRLTTLPANVFSGLTGATLVQLDRNTISTLDADAFNGLDVLTGLSLNGNSLSTLPSGIFSDISDTLESLNLSGNSFSTLVVDRISGLTRLKALDLSDNNLRALPAGLFRGLTNLTSARVQDNPSSGNTFTLTITPKRISDTMAVIEVVEGVPFTSVTADLTMTGGTFDATGVAMMSDVLIRKGETRSSPFEYTVDTSATSTIITASNPVSDPGNILDMPNGYQGFVLAAGAQPIRGGMCDRTPIVEDAIIAKVNALSSVTDTVTCLTVTTAQLGMITGTLSLSDLTRNNDTDDITALQAGDFAGLTMLERLDLQFNRIQTLPAGIFTDLTSLKQMNLAGNLLETLPSGVFSTLTSLETLSLDNNNIMSLDANIFSALTSVTFLNLHGNSLETLPGGVFSGVGVADFDGLTALASLRLSSNALTDLPSDLFNGLTNLTTLRLEENALTELPTGLFSGLTMLTGVSANRNNTNVLTLTPTLIEIDDDTLVVEIAQGVPFTDVMVTVTITGGEFSGSVSTMDLTLSKGATRSDTLDYTADENTETTISITTITPDPEDILDGFDSSTTIGYNGFALTAGRDITKGGICNRTAEVQAAILSRIDTLTADDCAMVTVAQLQAIDGVLDLSDPNDADNADDITTLLPGDFDNLTSLTTLNLGRNLLETLPAGIFDDLTSLTQLYLFQNRLQELREGVFSTLTNLTDLRIGSNQLTTLPPGIFSGLTNLAGVNAAFNPNALALTPTLTEISTGMFAIEIVQGVPFTSVTATVEITDQSNNTTTTTLTISKGMTQSEAFAFNPTTPSARLAISVVSDPINISLHFSGGVGFAGFELGDIDLGICDRTPQVQTTILAAINAMDGVSGITCLTATTAQLTAITDQLNVGSQSITAFLTGDFVGLTNLETLGLGGNRLNPTTLPSGLFSGLTNLNILILSDMFLETLPANIFNGLTNLTELNLSLNELTELPSGLFSDLTKVTILRLHGNNLTSAGLPSGIFSSLTSLETVWLNTNVLTELPDGLFSGLTNLNSVRVNEQRDTEGNAIASLPLTTTIQETGIDMAVVEVAQGVPFTSITATLSIDGGTFDAPAPGSGVTMNSNTEIEVTLTTGQTQSSPFTFDSSADTTTLMSTSIESTPSAILDGPSYKGFTLAEIPDLMIQRGVCGRTQEVQDAIIAFIDSALTCDMITPEQLATVNNLNLSDTTPNDDTDDIMSLQAGDFAGLTGLPFLNLRGQSLSTLDANIFADLSSLRLLDLSVNSLETLDADIFDGLSALENLNLRDNSLSTLDADIFDGLSALEVLFLHNNSLTTLDADIFDGLAALTALNLANNDLTGLLPDGIFSDLTNLVAVNVAGNPEDDSDPFTLTVVATESGSGSAAIEVAQGVPFDVTATLSITGGNFSGNPTTSVTLSRGMIRSIPVSYAVDTAAISATITVTISSPANDQIDGEYSVDPILGFSGYSGFQLASGPDLTVQTGICNRTSQVQTALLAAITETNDCAMVTIAQLETITNLDLNSQSIASLQSGDFAGLSALTALDLRNNDLTGLDANIFAGLSALTSLDLGGNDLTELDADIFAGLSALTDSECKQQQLNSSTSWNIQRPY